MTYFTDKLIKRINKDIESMSEKEFIETFTRKENKNMNFSESIAKWKRICDYYKERNKCIDDSCPLYLASNDLICNEFLNSIYDNSKEIETILEQWVKGGPEKTVALVEEWLKNNPVKTLLEVALEILPNIAMEEEKIPKLCPSDLFGEMAMSNNCKNVDGCLACWNRPAALIPKGAIKKNISKKDC